MNIFLWQLVGDWNVKIMRSSMFVGEEIEIPYCRRICKITHCVKVYNVSIATVVLNL